MLHSTMSVTTDADPAATPETLVHTYAAAASCMNSRLNVTMTAMSARFRWSADTIGLFRCGVSLKR